MTFHAYNPNLRYIPKFLGSTFVNLQTISITKTDLRLLEFRDFRHMKKLRKLYLPENKIERIAPCVFRYVDTVELINLDGNLIKELDDDTFVNLPSLLEFSANQNKIESLESGLFRNNLMLKRISLRSNQLKHIEINFLRIKAIEMADLQFNPCISLIFEAKGKLQLREFQNQTSGRCRGPEVCWKLEIWNLKLAFMYKKKNKKWFVINWISLISTFNMFVWLIQTRTRFCCFTFTLSETRCLQLELQPLSVMSPYRLYDISINYLNYWRETAMCADRRRIFAFNCPTTFSVNKLDSVEKKNVLLIPHISHTIDNFSFDFTTSCNMCEQMMITPEAINYHKIAHNSESI